MAVDPSTWRIGAALSMTGLHDMPRLAAETLGVLLDALG
jgi:hypothetical protein